MKVKLIALVVAGLFAQSASADENFMWGGSAEIGYRWTNVDGANRNGAYGNTTPLSATNPLTPFRGPVDGAKAQEYQDVLSAPIGVLDARGSNRTSYLRAFGEEFGRDDQFINIVGGGFGVWKASLYNNDIPHNYSFNALSPLTGSDTLLQLGPGGAYPNAQNPAIWHPFNYSTQRNTWGGNAEFSNKSPWFIRADYNEVKTTGVKPSSGRLGTSANNGFIELGAPVDYKTQNTTIEGGYSGKQYGIKLAYLDSKFSDGNDAFQWTNFYMRSAVDTILLPPDNDLKKWSLNGYIKQLPWDSAIIARFTQSKLTNGFAVVGSGLMPTGNAASYEPGDPAGRGLPLHAAVRRGDEPEPDELRRQHQDDHRERRVEREPDGAARHPRLLQLLRQAERLDRRFVPGGQPRQQLRHAARQQRHVLQHAGADRGGRRAFRLHEERGRFRRVVGVQPDQQGARRVRLEPDRAQRGGYGCAEQRRLPLLGRVPQQRLEQPERPVEVRIPAAALRPDQHRRGDERHPLLHGLLCQQLRRQRRQGEPRLDAGAAVVCQRRRDVARRRLQGQHLRPHEGQEPAVRRDRVVGRRRNAAHYRHRQLGQGRKRPELPGWRLSTADTEHVRELHMGKPEHAGRLDGRGARRLEGS